MERTAPRQIQVEYVQKGRPPIRDMSGIPRADDRGRFTKTQVGKTFANKVNTRFLMGCRGKHITLTQPGGQVIRGILEKFDDFSFIVVTAEHPMGILTFKGPGVTITCPDRAVMTWDPVGKKMVEKTK